MASSYESFKDLDLNKEEVERLKDALKDEQFRKMLVDYVDEVTNPENQKIYQNEIIQLEKERGVDVQFINPVAGYVIKTSVDGARKCFINVCSNELIQKPTSIPKSHDGSKGLEWSLPHSITPPREDLDNKKIRCQVYDVVFHPDTLHLAQNNKAFRNMVNNTACNAVESNFEVKLDKKNLKFPKLNYKGLPHAAMIRKQSAEKPREKSPEEQELLDKIFESIPKSEPPKSPKKTRKTKKIDVDDINNSNYTTPKYIIKHRSNVELEEFTEHKHSKMNVAIPKELVIEVNLPLLKSASDIVLDVAEKTLHLKSEKPAKYKLSLTLPYHVNQDNGNAKFDKDLKKIIITLPVKRSRELILSSEVSRDDSGVESDHGSPTRGDEEAMKSVEKELIQQLSSTDNTNKYQLPKVRKDFFLNPNVVYNLPEYAFHLYDNVFTFTLNVKNVSDSTIEKIFDGNSTIHVKFNTISSGFYPVHYAIFIKLTESTIDSDNVTIETWDNNVVLQIPSKPCDKIVNSYSLGTCESDAMVKTINDTSIINFPTSTGDSSCNKIEGSNSDDSDDPLTKKDTDDNSTSDTDLSQKELVSKSRAIYIAGTVSESSGDELSCSSYSPNKNRGILKRLSSARSSVSRSISESSIDDLMWASSFENCHASLDSVIPEDGEISTSLKKTVRFSNVVSRQVFR